MVTKEYKEPNVKAPRFRQNGVSIIDAEFLKDLKQKYPKYANLTESEINKIVKTFNETVWKEVIETRDGVQLPEGIGIIFIGTCQSPFRQNIDFAKSKKYGVTVTNKNWETDGKLAKIFYTSYSTNFKFQNRECWGFIPCRNFKRSVAKTYPENWTIYVQVDSVKKLREKYKKQIYRERMQMDTLMRLDTYNELDL